MTFHVGFNLITNVGTNMNMNCGHMIANVGKNVKNLENVNIEKRWDIRTKIGRKLLFRKNFKKSRKMLILKKDGTFEKIGNTIIFWKRVNTFEKR